MFHGDGFFKKSPPWRRGRISKKGQGPYDKLQKKKCPSDNFLNAFGDGPGMVSLYLAR
jgi:hypothetical protein